MKEKSTLKDVANNYLTHTKLNSGITLIALVVTIVVLLILAGITINMLFSDNGIITKAREAAAKTKEAQENEISGMKDVVDQIDKILGGEISNKNESYERLQKYFLGEDGKGLNIETLIEGENFKNNELIPNASTSIVIGGVTQDEDVLKVTVTYGGEVYVIVTDATTMITQEVQSMKKEVAELKEVDIRNLNATITQKADQDSWSSVLTLTVDKDENLQLTTEQKREILANMCGFSSFQLLQEYIVTTHERTYEESYTSYGYYSEDNFLDTVLLGYRNIIDYKNIEQLENAGLGVYTIVTPQGKQVYMTTLGGTVSCAVSENGSHTFEIKSGQYTNNQSVQVSSIRNKDTQAPHEVVIEWCTYYSEYTVDKPVLYSVDGTDEWNILEPFSTTSIICNNSVSFKNVENFETSNGVGYQGFQYVELDDEFYELWLNGYDWYFPNGYDTALGFVLALALYAQTGQPARYLVENMIFGDKHNDAMVEDATINAEYFELIDIYSEAMKEGEDSVDESALMAQIMASCPKFFADANVSGKIELDSTDVHTIDVTKDTKLYVSIEYCLTSDTYVLVEEWDEKKKRRIRRKKKIKDITYEDDLVVWDFDKGEYTTAKPLWIMKPRVTTKYNLLKFSDGSELKTIEQHRIFNKEAGKFTYPMTDETPIGTTTFTAEGKEIKLVSKEEVVVQEVEYINIITKYHMNLFANNILTSCRFSNLYPIEDMKYVKDDREIVGIEEYADIPEEYYYGLRLGEQPREINRTNDVHHASSIAEHIKKIYIDTAKEK